MFFITGCQSTGVVPLGQESYMVGKKDHSPGFGVSLGTKVEVYQEANAFCQAKGQEVKTLEIQTIPTRPGQFGSTELQFKCVEPGGTAQPLPKSPDTVIEIRQ